MEDYEINEKDIETIIRYLEIHDQKNADRDYAIQLLEQYKSLGAELARGDEAFAELIKKGLDKDTKSS